jgi:RNA polymerase sigma factor (sigma-70 family)
MKPTTPTAFSQQLPPSLTPDQEWDLWHSKDPVRIEKLILGTMRAAMGFVRSECRNRIPPCEQFSIAAECVTKAVEGYVPQSKGHRLMSYAIPFMRGAVAQYWRDTNVVRYGRDIPEKADPLNPPAPLVSMMVDPCFEEINLRERLKAVQPYIARLTESERRILVMHYEAGFTLADIGEMTGVTRAATQQMHAQALRKIRNMLIDSGTLEKLL